MTTPTTDAAETPSVDDIVQNACIEHVLGLEPDTLEDAKLIADGGTHIAGKYGWYDDFPEHMENPEWRERLTVLDFGYASLPLTFTITADGVRETWKQHSAFRSSGESACPYWETDSETPPAIVRVEDCTGVMSRQTHTIEHKPGEDVRCPYCAEKVGDAHGYTYIGDVQEVVYECVKEQEVTELFLAAEAVLAVMDALPFITPTLTTALKRLRKAVDEHE